MPKKQEFNFIAEVYKREVDINILREIELENLTDIIRKEFENGEEDFLKDLLLNNTNEYLSFRDDQFLAKMADYYDNDEEILISLLDVAKEIENEDNKFLGEKLLVDRKEYKIKEGE